MSQSSNDGGHMLLARWVRIAGIRNGELIYLNAEVSPPRASDGFQISRGRLYVTASDGVTPAQVDEIAATLTLRGHAPSTLTANQTSELVITRSDFVGIGTSIPFQIEGTATGVSEPVGAYWPPTQ